MNTKVKKQFRPFLLIEGKVSYELPAKAKDYYNFLIRKISKRTFNEKYWDNIFPDHTRWSKI